jgi:protein-ribulosamine 3-kinase
MLQLITGKGARALAEGEYYSVMAMSEAAPGLVPDAVGWGQYHVDDLEYFFYLGNYHDLDLDSAPDPKLFAARVAEFHGGTSPTGMFGFPVPTTIGIMERTVTWDQSWAKSFTAQLQDVVKYDEESNGLWPEFRVAMDHLINNVIPRLLGALQENGREIKPALVHGDLWEHNVGVDMESGEIIIFDPGCTYAHNEMEFGTWRCSWAYHFNSPIYMREYQRLIEPSEPVDEWDDRNRLYSLYPYMVDSAGHPGSESRKL